MTTEEKMSIKERYRYLKLVKPQYKQGDRLRRSQLLNDMACITGLHRKSLIRLMNGNLTRKARRRQRGRHYGADVDDVLRVIDESLDHICAERLTPNLVWMAEQLADHGELELTAELRDKLASISISTVKRILKRLRQDEPRLPQRKRKSSKKFTRHIPMRRIPWNEKIPGHFEVDLVHHCGPSASGEYVCTLQMVDVATGWSERFAVLGRGFYVMEHAFRSVLSRLPFQVLELHPDNGSEFFNAHLVRFWGDKLPDVFLSRSHPGRCNDNRIVEQKNCSLVRHYLGYDRLDTVVHVRLLNQIYAKMGLYYNLFQPVLRLEQKLWIPAPDNKSGHTLRRYDEARTPFDRLCDAKAIFPQAYNLLTPLRPQINPRALRKDIYVAIDQLHALPNAVPGVTECVFDTLVPPEPICINKHLSVTLSFGQRTSSR
jgi:hypothetical protein